MAKHSPKSAAGSSNRPWATGAEPATRSTAPAACCRADRLSARARSRLEDGLLRGDPEGEVRAAWLIYQHLLAVYPAPDAATGRTRLSRVIDEAISCPAPELARLGRTLRDWRTDIAAYFNTDRTSNRPTETVNLIIETTRRAAHGFRNFANNRLRLLLSHGVS